MRHKLYSIYIKHHKGILYITFTRGNCGSMWHTYPVNNAYDLMRIERLVNIYKHKVGVWQECISVWIPLEIK